MAASKKRIKKPHRRTWNAGGVLLKSEPWKIHAVFAPLESIIDQLEQDETIDVTPGGVAIFQDRKDGCWYDSVVAIMGVVDAYELHEVRNKRVINLDPLRQLANKLKYGMSIFPSDTEAVRACLKRMRVETMQMTADYAKQLIQDIQIKEELQKVAA